MVELQRKLNNKKHTTNHDLDHPTNDVEDSVSKLHVNARHSARLKDVAGKGAAKIAGKTGMIVARPQESRTLSAMEVRQRRLSLSVLHNNTDKNGKPKVPNNCTRILFLRHGESVNNARGSGT